MKILSIVALSFMLAAPLGAAKADPWKDEIGNSRGWREHSRQWDRDHRHSRRGERDRDHRRWDRDRGVYGSSFPYGYGGPYPWYGR
jgi:Ni/Co efflux regulator RcnB